MKKALKVIGISLSIIFLILIAIPYLFESQIKESVKTYVNKNINAQVDFADINLSLIRSFPKASLKIEELSIINNAPFEGDTLAWAKSLSFKMPIKDLFKNASDDPIKVNEIVLDDAQLSLKTDKDGNDNYDIAKNETSKDATKDNSGNVFAFDIERYSITQSAFEYLDQKSGVKVKVMELNHSGTGNFSADTSELDTSSNANVSLEVDSTSYLNNNRIRLDAIVDLDLKNEIYTFKENTGFVNDLPLKFTGSVKMLEIGQDIDITFENPESSFKDFLAVIPSQYSKEIENVSTTGNFNVNGMIKGINNDKRIPSIAIDIVSNNASFKYPSLPKSVSNININVSIKNDTGITDDTFVVINDFEFKIDQDEFKGNGTLRNISKNMLVNANLDGSLNLAHIDKAYPIELKNKLQGLIKGKLNTAFDMSAIKTNAYSRIKNNGSVTISDFIYSSEEIVNPINISEATLSFKPGTTTLKSFSAVTGQSDLEATGTLNNLMGFLLSDKNLQGTFNVNSNSFAISDFMVKDDSSTSSKETSIDAPLKIPSFLDATIFANAKTVIYDDLKLKDVTGELRIKDENASFKNVTSRLFDGNFALEGDINTSNEIPQFSMNLGVVGFDISQSFNNLELLQTIAPIAKALQGKLNSTITLSGNLANDYTPELSSISGDAIAEVLTSNIIISDSGVLGKLKGAMDFIEFDKLDLKDLKTKLNFANGQVSVSPFNIAYKDIDIVVSGSHGFDKSLNYQAVFKVPAKYLGKEINELILKINDPAVKNISIPVTANITGTYASPKVNSDLTSGISNLSKQLIEIQKQKLIDNGKDKIKDLLGGILGGKPGDSTEKDSSATQPKDTTASTLGTPPLKGDGKLKNDIKDVLGGLIGGKKKKNDSVVKKDSIN